MAKVKVDLTVYFGKEETLMMEVPDETAAEVTRLLEEWQETGNYELQDKLKELIVDGIGDSDITNITDDFEVMPSHTEVTSIEKIDEH